MILVVSFPTANATDTKRSLARPVPSQRRKREALLDMADVLNVASDELRRLGSGGPALTNLGFIDGLRAGLDASRMLLDMVYPQVAIEEDGPGSD